MANIKLKKGEMLFSEGDPSRSMYFIQSGTLRLFKKKSESAVELGIIYRGEVIGEMGFLDGGPRSASAEAIHDTELVEITNDKLHEQLKVIPSWLMVLLKTVVKRLRSANTKIKQLEGSSSQITYGKNGPSHTYVFLPVHDVMKLTMALLTVASRNGEAQSDKGIKIRPALLQKYASQILSIHLSKTTEILDIFEKVGILKIEKIPDPAGERTEIFIRDINMLEYFLNFVNEENLKDHSKKLTFSAKGVKVLGLICKYIENYPPNSEGFSCVNMANVLEAEKSTGDGKRPYLDEDFNELVKNKVASELSIKDSNTMVTLVHATSILKLYKMQRILKEIDTVNEEKRRKVA